MTDSLIDQKVPHSLSFGLSVLSGIFHDLTANVWYCSFRAASPVVYGVALSKTSFILVDGDSRKAFFIPPLPALLQLHGIGEFFHPRTKVSIPHDARNERSQFVSGIHSCSYFSAPDMVVTDRPLLEGFIAKHACILDDFTDRQLPLLT